MTPNEELRKAITLASLFHGNVLDKTNRPSILHPMRVMASLDSWHDENFQLMAVAILHDTVEDTAMTLDDLKITGFSTEVVDAVDAMTRRKGEVYMDYIKRVEKNPMAKQVKMADLMDNFTRNDLLPEKQQKGLKQRYKRAMYYLRTGEDHGNNPKE